MCLSSSCRKERISGRRDVMEPTTYVEYFTQKFYNIFEYDENLGNEDFLENARKILIQEKSKKMQRRRQEMDQRRRKRRQEEKEKRMKKVENILDKAFSRSFQSQETQTENL